MPCPSVFTQPSTANYAAYKKSLPPLACPTYKFGVAHEFTVKGEWKISATLPQAQHQRLKAGAALVKMAEEEGNGWYIATEHICFGFLGGI